MQLTHEIDSLNYQFIAVIKNQLKDLNKFSNQALEFLMLEHYQFSARNTSFLAAAEQSVTSFKISAIAAELRRNFDEEKNHAALYKKSLFAIGTDVDKRHTFLPTSQFFENISTVIASCPSMTLGAIYATETAAIFEHEVFLDISQHLVQRREKDWEKSRLKAFHEMHLNGVEQAHKDGLGRFVDQAVDDDSQTIGVAHQQFIQKKQVQIGAARAISAMKVWWQELLNQAENLGDG